MKRVILWALGGLFAAVVAIGGFTSCDKVEHPKELGELFALILEGKLQHEGNFTPESWTPFAAALEHAERVAGSKAPTLEALTSAYKTLHDALHALKPRAQPRGLTVAES
jgi:hypothetical protein